MLIRGHHDFDGQFTQVPNAWLRDSRISLGAKGLIAQLLSHKPGWGITVQGLAKQNGCGKDKIRTIVHELEAYGYLTRSKNQRHDSRGYLAGYDYITGNPPLAGLPTKDEPTKDAPTKENPPHKKTIQKKTIEKKTIEEETQRELLDEAFEQFWTIYPRRVGKASAKRAFTRAVKDCSIEDVLSGTRRLSADPNLPETQFIPYPATWLNRDGWTDDPYPDRGGKKQETKRLIDEWLRTEDH